MNWYVTRASSKGIGNKASAPSKTGKVGHSSAATGVERSLLVHRCDGVTKADAHRFDGAVRAALAARRVDRVLGRMARGAFGPSRPVAIARGNIRLHRQEFAPAAELERHKSRALSGLVC